MSFWPKLYFEKQVDEVLRSEGVQDVTVVPEVM